MSAGSGILIAVLVILVVLGVVVGWWMARRYRSARQWEKEHRAPGRISTSADDEGGPTTTHDAHVAAETSRDGVVTCLSSGLPPRRS
jgi:hypothetical protein